MIRCQTRTSLHGKANRATSPGVSGCGCGNLHSVTVTNMMCAAGSGTSGGRPDSGTNRIVVEAVVRHCHIVAERRPALSTYRGFGDQELSQRRRPACSGPPELRGRHCQLVVENRVDPGSSHVFPDYCHLFADRTPIDTLSK